MVARLLFADRLRAPRRTALLLLTGVLTVMASACNNAPTEPVRTRISPVGRWLLIQAGEPARRVPADLRFITGQAGILGSGSLEIEPSGFHVLYIDRRRVMVSGDTIDFPAQSEGNTRISGQQIQLVRRDGSWSVADFGERMLTLRHDNMTLVFRRDTLPVTGPVPTP